jgi:hypothetical protein
MQMVKKIFAILLFFYAAWQIFTAFSASRQGQGFAQIFWALLATAGGVYLLRKQSRNK